MQCTFIRFLFDAILNYCLNTYPLIKEVDAVQTMIVSRMANGLPSFGRP